ncbi:MAG TPA: cytochrome C oxidase subunit IV family protein [Puia sp.]|nr:cytochrome C oxidase subunit IV family protein [Puia sp.]
MSSIETTGRDNAHATFDTRPIWRTFWVLLVITLVELTLATIHIKTGGKFPPKYVLNGIYLILTCAKAFYIIAEFMHLRHEIKNMIMTIAVPACLFIWFIVAFLWDGGSYNQLRNRYDRHYADQSKVKVEQPAEKPGKPE